MKNKIQVHQILPSFVPGDAIGGEVVEIRKLLRSWGYKSNVYVEHLSPVNAHETLSYFKYAEVSSSRNILIYHFSIGSGLSRFIRTLPDRKVLIYHNVTPYQYYVGVNDYLAYLLRSAREELEDLRGVVDLTLADSEYNRQELVGFGFEKTAVLPLIIDFGRYAMRPDRKILQRYQGDYVNILFVGRFSPNKRHEDLVKVFYCYKNFINSKSRLFLVGDPKGAERYLARLKSLIKKLDLNDVYITGPVDFRSLISYYHVADVFLSMSEHEGFCVPLLESMYFDIPIIAYNEAAAPWTLASAGVLINDRSHLEIAELINLIMKDESLRARLVENGRRRLKDFDRSKIAEALKRYIEEVSA